MVSDSPAKLVPPSTGEDQPALPAPWGRTLLLIAISLALSTALCWCLGREELPPEHGKITGHATPLVSDWTGRVERFLVKPGEKIQAGEPIAILFDEGLQLQIHRQQKERADIQRALERAEKRADTELARQLSQIDAEIVALKTQSGIDSLDLPDGAFDEISARADRLRDLEARRINLAHETRELLGVTRLRNAFVLAEARLHRLESQHLQMTVPAPVSGTVGRILRKPGERIVQGTPLMEVADQDQPFLVVEMPEPIAKRFALGDKIPLKFSTLEHGMGRVSNMQRLEAPKLDAPSDGETDKPKSRIRVMIEPIDGDWPEVPLDSSVKVRTSDSRALSRRVH